MSKQAISIWLEMEGSAKKYTVLGAGARQDANSTWKDTETLDISRTVEVTSTLIAFTDNQDAYRDRNDGWEEREVSRCFRLQVSWSECHEHSHIPTLEDAVVLTSHS